MNTKKWKNPIGDVKFVPTISGLRLPLFRHMLTEMQVADMAAKHARLTNKNKSAGNYILGSLDPLELPQTGLRKVLPKPAAEFDINTL